jgi:putative SOS response-associated peptidase YedK
MEDPATGLWVPSAAVITTDANHDVGTLHDRMPVLLPRDAWASWLDPEQTDQGLLLALLGPAPDGVLEMHPVSRRVNDVRNDGPDLVDPVPDVATNEVDRPTARRAAASDGRRGPADGQATLFD